jgi:hypothetical protein
MDTKSVEFKTKVVSAAIEIYIEERQAFTLRNIAKKAKCKVEEIQAIYPGKQAILKGYYALIPDRYRETVQEIEGFETLSIGDQISNYVYTTFDILSEQRDFVEETFEENILRGGKSSWERESAKIFRKLIESDPRIPQMNKLLLRDFMFDTIAKEYLQIVRFWVHDDSEGSERTLALVDKIASFGTEIAYSGVLDSGLDLAKYVFGNDIWKSRMPSLFNDISQFANNCMKKAQSCNQSYTNKPRPSETN